MFPREEGATLPNSRNRSERPELQELFEPLRESRPRVDLTERVAQRTAHLPTPPPPRPETLLGRVADVGLAVLALPAKIGIRGALRSLATRIQYRGLIRPGDRLVVGEHDGIVTRVTPVAIVLTANEGEKVVPCEKLGDDVITIERLPDVPTRGGSGDGTR